MLGQINTDPEAATMSEGKAGVQEIPPTLTKYIFCKYIFLCIKSPNAQNTKHVEHSAKASMHICVGFNTTTTNNSNNDDDNEYK